MGNLDGFRFPSPFETARILDQMISHPCLDVSSSADHMEKEMKEYLEDKDAVLKELESTLSGLDEMDAAKRLEVHGPNKLEEKKKESLLKRFFKELSDPMLIILMIAAVLSIANLVFLVESECVEAIIILTVAIINAILGVVQESKVRRGGKLVTLDSEDLVS